MKKNKMNKNKRKKKKKKNNNNNNNNKRTPAPPGNVRPNSFVPRVPKATHAGKSSLASTKCHCLFSFFAYSIVDLEKNKGTADGKGRP